MSGGAIIPTAVPLASNIFCLPERNVVRRGSFGPQNQDSWSVTIMLSGCLTAGRCKYKVRTKGQSFSHLRVQG